MKIVDLNKANNKIFEQCYHVIKAKGSIEISEIVNMKGNFRISSILNNLQSIFGYEIENGIVKGKEEPKYNDKILHII